MGRKKMSESRGARRRWVSWALALLLAVALGAGPLGCSQAIRVGMDEFPAGGTGRAQVFLRDGSAYDFAQTHAARDTLFGRYTVVTQRVSPEGLIAYVDEPRTIALPYEKIAYVEFRKLDLEGTALMGAGAVLLGFWANSVIDTGSHDPLPDGGSSSGKPTFPE